MRNYSTEDRKRQRLFIILIIIAVILGLLIGKLDAEAAADAATVQAYVICRPGDCVNIRAGASRDSMAVGRLDCGDEIRLDGTTKNGWARLADVTLDSPGDAWIHLGYIVFDKPRKSGTEMQTVGPRHVLARTCCNGDVTARLKPGTVVQVIVHSDEWCITNRGYIATEWLEVTAYE